MRKKYFIKDVRPGVRPSYTASDIETMAIVLLRDVAVKSKDQERYELVDGYEAAFAMGFCIGRHWIAIDEDGFVVMTFLGEYVLGLHSE